MVIRTGMTLNPPRGIGAWCVDECSRSGHMGDFNTGRYLRDPDARDTLGVQGGCRISRSLSNLQREGSNEQVDLHGWC